MLCDFTIPLDFAVSFASLDPCRLILFIVFIVFWCVFGSLAYFFCFCLSVSPAFFFLFYFCNGFYYVWLSAVWCFFLSAHALFDAYSLPQYFLIFDSFVCFISFLSSHFCILLRFWRFCLALFFVFVFRCLVFSVFFRISVLRCFFGLSPFASLLLLYESSRRKPGWRFTTGMKSGARSLYRGLVVSTIWAFRTLRCDVRRRVEFLHAKSTLHELFRFVCRIPGYALWMLDWHTGRVPNRVKFWHVSEIFKIAPEALFRWYSGVSRGPRCPRASHGMRAQTWLVEQTICVIGNKWLCRTLESVRVLDDLVFLKLVFVISSVALVWFSWICTCFGFVSLICWDFSLVVRVFLHLLF